MAALGLEIPIYQVDAFADELFRGNPAAVCPLDQWLPEPVMQAIAAENALSETAFLVPRAPGFEIRWFTPTVEVDLCGHATLASAFVVLVELGAGQRGNSEVAFHSPRSGELRVTREGELLELDFPALPPRPCDPIPEVSEGLRREPRELLVAEEYLAVFDREEEVAALDPDMAVLARVGRCVIATAPGQEVDFVSRFFAPAVGIPEDPVTGSAHCTLTPYWARRLGKSELAARQISKRGGELRCFDRGERVSIAGRAVCYLRGAITV